MCVVTLPSCCEVFRIEVRSELRVVVATFTGPVLRMRDGRSGAVCVWAGTGMIAL